MNSGEFDRVMKLFEEACRLEPSARAEFLARSCGSDIGLRERVEELLRHDSNPAGFGRAATVGGGAELLARGLRVEETMAASDVRSVSGAKLPAEVGRYRVLRELGRGGMGVVYEAEQDHPRRRVALKMLAPWLSSRELVRRFEHECQILGRLRHPGIAQIYDAGAADVGHGPQPYFAMEFVPGQPLSEYAAGRSLSHREKLALIERICRAVEHAHRKGVIHRDLKPANILVSAEGDEDRAKGDRPAPKILDFGIARVTDSDLQATTLHTDVGQLIGTLPYMSPEQVAGDSCAVDTRSDVYALGVITFELLAGRLPLDLRRKPVAEAARIVREQDPPRLGAVDRACKGDVEAIVGKAMEKDPARRYQSAADLADDIARFLAGEPILARVPSAAYQLRKFVLRHKLPSALAASFVAALIVFSAAMSVLYARAVNAERLAGAQAETARRTSDFLVNLFQVNNPDQAKGNTITAREILDQGAARVDKELAGQPGVQAAMMQTIGSVYNNLGLFDQGGVLLTRAVEQRRELFGTESLEYAESAAAAARWYNDTGRHVEAENHLREANRVYREQLSDADDRVTQVISELGTTLFHLSKYTEAEPLLNEALNRFRGVAIDPQVGSADMANVMNNLALLYAGTGRRAEALKLAQETDAMQRRVLDPNDPARTAILTNLAKMLEQEGDFATAREHRREALRIGRLLYGEDSPLLANELDGLGQLSWHLGDYDAAEGYFREAVERYRRALGPDNSMYAFAVGNLGALNFRKGHYLESEQNFREALALNRKAHGDESRDTAMIMSNLGAALWEGAKYDEAESVLREALRIRQKLNKGDDAGVATTMSNLAGLLVDVRKLEEAETLARDSLAMRRRIKADHPDVGESLNRLGQVLLARGQAAEAIPIFQDGEQMLRKTAGETHPNVGYLVSGQGEAMLRLNRAAEAEPLLREALRIWATTLPAEHRDVIHTQSLLGECLMALGRTEEAERVLLAVGVAVDRLPAISPARRQQILDRVEAVKRVSAQNGG